MRQGVRRQLARRTSSYSAAPDVAGDRQHLVVVVCYFHARGEFLDDALCSWNRDHIDRPYPASSIRTVGRLCCVRSFIYGDHLNRGIFFPEIIFHDENADDKQCDQ